VRSDITSVRSACFGITHNTDMFSDRRIACLSSARNAQYMPTIPPLPRDPWVGLNLRVKNKINGKHDHECISERYQIIS
jgi:hypothetical protein